MKNSVLANTITNAVSSFAGVDEMGPTFDHDRAAKKVDEILKQFGMTEEILSEMQRDLQAERDCVLRQQREINRLKQHIADTPAAVLS